MISYGLWNYIETFVGSCTIAYRNTPYNVFSNLLENMIGFDSSLSISRMMLKIKNVMSKETDNDCLFHLEFGGNGVGRFQIYFSVRIRTLLKYLNLIFRGKLYTKIEYYLIFISINKKIKYSIQTNIGELNMQLILYLFNSKAICVKNFKWKITSNKITTYL